MKNQTGKQTILQIITVHIKHVVDSGDERVKLVRSSEKFYNCNQMNNALSPWLLFVASSQGAQGDSKPCKLKIEPAAFRKLVL